MASGHDVLVSLQNDMAAQLSAMQRALDEHSRYALDVVSCQSVRLRHLEWQIESLGAENRTSQNGPDKPMEQGNEPKVPGTDEESAPAEKQRDEVKPDSSEEGQCDVIKPWRDTSEASTTAPPNACKLPAHVQARLRAARSTEHIKEPSAMALASDEQAEAESVVTPPRGESSPRPSPRPSASSDIVERPARRLSQSMTDAYLHGGSLEDMLDQRKAGVLDTAALRRKWLDNLSLTLILLNTIYMALEAQLRMQVVVGGLSIPGWVWWGNVFIALAFGGELVAKAAILRSDFCRKSWGHSFYDVFHFVCTLCDVIAEGLNVSFFRSLRVVRAVRASKALQIIHYVQQLRPLVASIICSLPSLFWAFVLLLVALYLMALLIMQGVEEHLRLNGPNEELTALYGHLWVSMLSLFMAVSGGRDWVECVDPLYSVSPLYVLVFALFVTFVVFGVVNILTAVFIEAASGIIDIDRDLVAQRHRKEEKATIKQLQNLFEELDIDKSGKTSQEEILEMFQDSGVKGMLKTLELEAEQAQDFLKLMDFDENDEINIGDFVVTLMAVRGTAKGTDLAANLRETKGLFKQLSGEMKDLAANVEQIRLMERSPPEGYSSRPSQMSTEIHL